MAASLLCSHLPAVHGHQLNMLYPSGLHSEGRPTDVLMGALFKEESEDQMRKTKIATAIPVTLRIAVSSFFLDNGVHAARARHWRSDVVQRPPGTRGNEASRSKIRMEVWTLEIKLVKIRQGSNSLAPMFNSNNVTFTICNLLCRQALHVYRGITERTNEHGRLESAPLANKTTVVASRIPKHTDFVHPIGIQRRSNMRL